MGNRSLAGRRLKDIRLPANCLVLLVRREGELLAPRGSTVLQPGDYLTLAGDRESVWEATGLLSQPITPAGGSRGSGNGGERRAPAACSPVPPPARLLDSP